MHNPHNSLARDYYSGTICLVCGHPIDQHTEVHERGQGTVELLVPTPAAALAEATSIKNPRLILKCPVGAKL